MALFCLMTVCVRVPVSRWRESWCAGRLSHTDLKETNLLPSMRAVFVPMEDLCDTLTFFLQN